LEFNVTQNTAVKWCVWCIELQRHTTMREFVVIARHSLASSWRDLNVNSARRTTCQDLADVNWPRRLTFPNPPSKYMSLIYYQTSLHNETTAYNRYQTNNIQPRWL